MKDNWIYCNERLPEKSDRYFSLVEENNNYEVYISHYDASHNVWWKESQTNAIAWMPLPDPPCFDEK